MKMTINDETYTVDHDALNRNSGNGVEYFTTGKDQYGNSVEIIWETLPDWDYTDPANADRIEDACDWNKAEIIITESFAFSDEAKNIQKITGINYYSKEAETFVIDLSEDEIKEVILQNRMRETEITNIDEIPIYVDLNNIYLAFNGKVITQQDSEDMTEVANEKNNCYGEA
ncbi:hypothetical protein H8D64_01260 [PVC group bacterium]|nr:hypothetical protein [PVC group bacterium]